jgi:hypothetical protein
MALGKTEGLVNFVTGSRITPTHIQHIRDQATLVRQASWRQVSKTHPAYEVMEFINTQPPNSSTKVIGRNMPNAVEKARAIQTPDRREYALRVLDAISLAPRQIYLPSPRTVRIHACGASPDRLPREIRKQLFEGCTEIDLVASQLTIVSHVWKIPKITQILEAPEGFWTKVLTDLGLVSEHKPILKTAIYATIFGMKPRNVNRLLRTGGFTDQIAQEEQTDVPPEELDHLQTEQEGPPTGIGDRAFQRLVRTGWFRDLRKAREERYNTLWKEQGYVDDAFGRKITYSDLNNPGPWKAGKRKTNSLMAIEVQSYEMKIMSAIIPIIKSEGNITIVSWLHDGVTLHFRDTRERPRQLTRLKRALGDSAKQLGISMKTEVTHLG